MILLSSSPSQTPQAYRILIVDDDPDILDAYNEFFTMEGFKTTKASDGLEAQDIFSADQFDLIVTDVRMPRCNGIEFYDAVRKVSDRMPIIFVSAYSEIAMNNIQRDSFAKVLQKPVQIESLLERVQYFLKPKS